MSTDGPFPLLGAFIECGSCLRPISTPQRELIDRPRHNGFIWCDQCESFGGLSEAARHALSVSRLQGYVPSRVQIDLLHRLDTGEITADEAMAITVAKYQRQREATDGLSEASQYGLALNRLQGYEPTPEFLEVLRRLDAGEITDEEAIEQVARLARKEGE